jgi:exonuclease III
MAGICKVLTLNISGIRAASRIEILENFLRLHEVDIAMLQEVVGPQLETVRGYVACMNIGSTVRGTAILVRQGLTIDEMRRLPTGRGVAIRVRNQWFANLYAPSGAEKREERERFYAVDVIQLIPTACDEFLLGGDFNCVLYRADVTGSFTYSPAFDALVRGMRLTDAWDQTLRPVYTHYTATGASRLDRFYLSQALCCRKTGIETVAAGFTDHFAVILRLTLGCPGVIRGRGL